MDPANERILIVGFIIIILAVVVSFTIISMRPSPTGQVTAPSEYCGDGICRGMETCRMCPIDCGECGITKETTNCGDGECESLESCAICPEDCGECPFNGPTTGTSIVSGVLDCPANRATFGAYNKITVLPKFKIVNQPLTIMVVKVDGRTEKPLARRSVEIEFKGEDGQFKIISTIQTGSNGNVQYTPENIGTYRVKSSGRAASFEVHGSTIQIGDATCGNEICEDGENPDNCPEDCTECGDGICEGPEDKGSCPDDCEICGDGVCDTSEYDRGQCYCIEDCVVCGDGFCDKNYGEDETCPEDCVESSIVVSRVIDGDTIELQSGEEVRLLGINAPESGQKCYQDATNRLKVLVEGKEVVLESDEQDKDQYNRLLRYVHVGDTFVNLKMIEEGLANVYILPPNTKFKLELEQAEALAKQGDGCLWEKSLSCADCIQVYNFHYDASGNDCYNLNGEYVTLRNKCGYSCDMTGWSVKDEARHIYFFQEFSLGSKDKVTLYTGFGTDSQTKLYWGSSGYQCNAIWNNDGDTLYLRDFSGSIVLTYGY